MKNRNPEIIKEEILDLNKILSETKDVIKAFPDDEILKYTYEQDKVRLEVLNAELIESLSEHRQHTIKYVIKSDMKEINLDLFIKSMNTFKELAEQVKSTLVKSKEQFSLNFETVFAGSYGILLSTPFETKICGSAYENILSLMFDTINEMNNEEDIEKLDHIIENKLLNNKKLITKFKNFYKTIADSQNNVKLEWNSPTYLNKATEIEYVRAEKINNYLITNQVETKEVKVTGLIKGISLINNKIELQLEQIDNEQVKVKKNINLQISHELAENYKHSIDEELTILVDLTQQYNEATDEVKEKWVFKQIIL